MTIPSELVGGQNAPAQSGQLLAAAVFGADVVDRDWPGYEEAVEIRCAGGVASFVGMTRRIILMNDQPVPVAEI